MSHQSNTTTLAPNGCPIDTRPHDPTRLFSSQGITLDIPRIGWIVAGCFTLLATLISFVLIYRHLQYYTKANQQRYIVRMLLMVPIYAITSWFSFVYVHEAVYYDKIRILYEAFVIASFLILMLQYMGDSREDQKRVLKRHKKTERWLFPLCCLKYNPSRPHFLQYMKWGILQYVPLQILGTVLTIVLETQGYYCESSWSPKFGHVWILLLNFISVSVATYFLIMFYFTVREELKEYSPFYKFMAVKLVVFFSFWQLVVVEGLVYFGIIKETTYWSTANISVGINAVLIDIEMVFFALMHVKAFSYKPYFVMDYTQKTPIWKGLVDSFNPLDTIRELGYGVKYLYRWARGVPVDKDSRRLLDLEHVFGRQR
ncbi:MAG: organic solute transporter Ostalpha-domain-containing protein, partial [Benniella sp.]